MIESLSVLLVCQLAGEIPARLSGAPLPGPATGTERALETDQRADAFSSLVMGLNVLAAAHPPLLVRVLDSKPYAGTCRAGVH